MLKRLNVMRAVKVGIKESRVRTSNLRTQILLRHQHQLQLLPQLQPLLLNQPQLLSLLQHRHSHQPMFPIFQFKKQLLRLMKRFQNESSITFNFFTSIQTFGLKIIMITKQSKRPDHSLETKILNGINSSQTLHLHS